MPSQVVSIRSRGRATPRAAAAVVLACGVLGAGCGGSDPAPATTSVAAPTVTAAAEPVELKVDDYANVVGASFMVLRGTVTPGAHVSARGHEAKVTGGRWRVRVPLEQGPNQFNVVAEKPGLATTEVPVAAVGL